MNQFRNAITALVCVGIFVVFLFAMIPAEWGAPSENAVKTEARSQARMIVAAVNAYYEDNHKYPVATPAGGVVVFSSDNNTLFDVLRDCTGPKSGNALNPRNVAYVEAPVASDQAHPCNGVQLSTGIWFDPWGSPYRIAIDTTGSGELNGSKTTIPGFYTDVGPLKASVIVWSLGKNGELGGGPATKPGFKKESGSPGVYAGSGDVGSW
ncbi:MAG TPA: hypothetical protein VG733_00775 [Chthoniobacteraceae bacterium]|nr:hypothetical protein [Chthoniobacteraceae bacterium]